MKPPFAYFGGKSRLAPWIVSLMPPHRVYVEAFAGSAAVLFAKAPCQHEILNDLSGGLVNFFAVLRDDPGQLERVVSLTPFSRQEFEACENHADPTLDPIERARRWWVRSTQGFGQSTAKTGWSISINPNVNRPTSLITRIDRFRDLAERLRGCFIESRPAISCIERYGAPDAVIYADPPYLDVTRTSFNDAAGNRRRPNGDYEVEYQTEDDHRELAAALLATPATVLLSGYESDLYDDLYADWWRVERRVTVHSSNGMAKGPRPRNLEVVWCNRPYGEGRLFSAHDVAAAT